MGTREWYVHRNVINYDYGKNVCVITSTVTSKMSVINYDDNSF